MISKRSDANPSKPWKISQKRCFALRIKLENNGRTIGTKLAAYAAANGLTSQYRTHLSLSTSECFKSAEPLLVGDHHDVALAVIEHMQG